MLPPNKSSAERHKAGKKGYIIDKKMPDTL